jgi:hypothetical protein
MTALIYMNIGNTYMIFLIEEISCEFYVVVCKNARSRSQSRDRELQRQRCKNLKRHDQASAF